MVGLAPATGTKDPKRRTLTGGWGTILADENNAQASVRSSVMFLSPSTQHTDYKTLHLESPPLPVRLMHLFRCQNLESMATHDDYGIHDDKASVNAGRNNSGVLCTWQPIVSNAHRLINMHAEGIGRRPQERMLSYLTLRHFSMNDTKLNFH